MTQTVYPISDIGRSNISDWDFIKDCDSGTNGTLWDCLNQAAIGPPCQDEFSGCGAWNVYPNPLHLLTHSMYFEVGLNTLSTPSVRTGHKVVMKIIDGSSHTCLVTAEIRQSGVTKGLVQQLYTGVASIVDCSFSRPASYDTLEFDFDEVDMDLITDYSVLTLKVTVTKNGGGVLNTSPFIGTTRFDIPDAVSIPASVVITPATIELENEDDTQICVAQPYDSGSNPISCSTDITWASNNTSVATVDSDGLITAISPGSATITATCSGVSGTAAVRVLFDCDDSPVSNTFTDATIGSTAFQDLNVAFDPSAFQEGAAYTAESDPAIPTATQELV